MTDTLPIVEIKIGERCRIDLGDHDNDPGCIKELAASMDAIGLLHPVVVTAGHDLVAGERRLVAARSLGWTDIPVTVVDIDNAADTLRAELEENTCRRSLSAYEADVLREKRERVLAEDARRRQWEGQERGRAARHDLVSSKLDETSEALPGMPSRPVPVVDAESTPIPSARATRKVAAIGTGYSGSTLDKVRKIRDVAERGVVRNDKVEVPVPEPARAVAREALEEVKVTGAAVDRASRKVEKALEGFVDDSVDVQRAKLRRSWRGAFSAAMGLDKFDPTEVATVLEPSEWTEVEIAVRELNGWYDRLLSARQGGLRVVGGER